MTYAGHFANALGNLNPKQESQAEESGEKSKSGNWVKWRILILRTWAVDFLPTPSHWAATTRVF